MTRRLDVRAEFLLVALAALAAGCSRQPKLYNLSRDVHETWDHCVYVAPDHLKIEHFDQKTVRFSYELVVQVPGSYAGQVECPMDKRLLLEALTHKDIAELKYGERYPVTQETPY
jgi:hypothetical protein